MLAGPGGGEAGICREPLWRLLQSCGLTQWALPFPAIADVAGHSMARNVIVYIKLHDGSRAYTLQYIFTNSIILA